MDVQASEGLTHHGVCATGGLEVPAAMGAGEPTGGLRETLEDGTARIVRDLVEHMLLSTIKQLLRQCSRLVGKEGAMRTPLAIPVPTAEELAALDHLYRTTRDVRLRTRAQIIL